MDPSCLHVRPATTADRSSWLVLRERLWPTPPEEESVHSAEIDAFFAGDTRVASVVLLVVPGEATAEPVGFAELSLRSAVEGCHTDPVAYLEGWYVEPSFRRQGVGAALIRAAEAWARALGCTEMGSDVELDNAGSLAAHARLGFQEVERVVLFRKDL
jgi:aminoglycoside 6'-N-acetyltransferase I